MAVLGVIVRDVLGAAGAGLLSYGVWMAYHPGGFMVGGSLLLIWAVLASRGAA
jgi:hypothetical protein